MALAKLKKIAQSLLAEGNYPKKDGGVKALAGDEGDIVVIRDGKNVIYQFTDHDDEIVLPVPINKGPKKNLPKRTAPLVPQRGKAKPDPGPPESSPEPQWVEQMNYNRTPELVDFNIYRNVIQCECGNIRYVRNSDLHQVTMCKPCTRKARRKRRREVRKLKGLDVKGSSFVSNKEKEKDKGKGKKEAPKKTAPKKETSRKVANPKKK
jgi:signal peptidase I